jgi:hypothetical protein
VPIRALATVGYDPAMVLLTLVLLAIVLWTIYKVVVYALPCLIGYGVGSVAFSTNAGWVGASLVGLAAAVSSFMLLRFLVAQVQSRPLRWALATLLTIPSIILAYSITVDALASGVPSETWRRLLAAIFGLAAGWIAFALG